MGKYWINKRNNVDIISADDFNVAFDEIEKDINNKLEIENYVHTDNNFTSEYKQKLDILENYNDTEVKQNISGLQENKVNKTDYASISQAGIMKLYSGSNKNRSGLVVSENDGTVYVYTGSEYGTNRSGDGRIQVVKASDDEIANRSSSYKPIVPANLDLAVQSVTGDFTKLNTDNKSNLVNAVNEINNTKADKTSVRPKFIIPEDIVIDWDTQVTDGTYYFDGYAGGIIDLFTENFYMNDNYVGIQVLKKVHNLIDLPEFVEMGIRYAGDTEITWFGRYGVATQVEIGVIQEELQLEANTRSAVDAGLEEFIITKSDKLTEITDTTSTEITVSLQANTVYQYGTLESFTISSYEISHYETVIYFTSGDTATSLTIPSEMKKRGDIVINPNKEYIISIQNGILIMGEVG